MGFNKKNQKGIVILTNSVHELDPVGFAYLTGNLSKIKLTKPVVLSTESLQKLNGNFELTPNFIMTITDQDQQLFLQATGQQKVLFTALSETEFVNKTVQAKIVFELNKNGEAESLTLHQGGQVMKAKKLTPENN